MRKRKRKRGRKRKRVRLFTKGRRLLSDFPRRVIRCAYECTKNNVTLADVNGVRARCYIVNTGQRHSYDFAFLFEANTITKC